MELWGYFLAFHTHECGKKPWFVFVKEFDYSSRNIGFFQSFFSIVYELDTSVTLGQWNATHTINEDAVIR
jgi:hypothetical protein